MDTPRHLLLAQKIFREMADADCLPDLRTDIDAVWEVILAARRVCEPADPALDRRLLSPVVRLECGVELRSLPWGVDYAAHQLLQGLSDTSERYLLGMAYAAAHTQDRAFWECPPPPRTYANLVRSWARRMDATRVEIITAVAELFERDYEGLEALRGGGTSVGLYRMLEALTREYSHDAGYWLWVATSDEIEALFHAMAARQDAEEREAMKATAGKDRMPRLSVNDYEVRAMDALIRTRDRLVGTIKERRKANDEQS